MTAIAPAAGLLVAVACTVVALAAAGSPLDRDRDGLDDRLEDSLAEKFAPIVHHERTERNYPVNVDWLLARTSLREHDARIPGGREIMRPISDQAALVAHSDGARSACKQSGLFVADVDAPHRAGLRDDPSGWTTYVHTYRNVGSGITLQYWRLYAFNELRVLFAAFSHGGDWEGLAVHLDAELQPATVGLLGHTSIERVPARDVAWEGTHPLIWSEEGGHSSRKARGGWTTSPVTRQETWTGGRVVWWDGRVASGGGLVNVGEKSTPRDGQAFIQYSGLWGSPHRWYLTSGYWGPAFNETEAACDGGRAAYRMSLGCGAASNCPRISHTAWCDGMDPAHLDRNRECYAARRAP